MSMDKVFPIEILFAKEQHFVALCLQVPVGTTIREAIQIANIDEEMGGLLEKPFDLEYFKVGIWGALKSPDTILASDDRIEIYLPLIADAKIWRHGQAKVQAKAARRAKQEAKAFKRSQASNPVVSG